jgi:hypothetical protein
MKFIFPRRVMRGYRSNPHLFSFNSTQKPLKNLLYFHLFSLFPQISSFFLNNLNFIGLFFTKKALFFTSNGKK